MCVSSVPPSPRGRAPLTAAAHAHSPPQGGRGRSPNARAAAVASVSRRWRAALPRLARRKAAAAERAGRGGTTIGGRGRYRLRGRGGRRGGWVGGGSLRRAAAAPREGRALGPSQPRLLREDTTTPPPLRRGHRCPRCHPLPALTLLLLLSPVPPSAPPALSPQRELSTPRGHPPHPRRGPPVGTPGWGGGARGRPVCPRPPPPGGEEKESPLTCRQKPGCLLEKVQIIVSDAAAV